MVPGTAAAATARFAAPGGSTTDPNCDAAHPCEIHRALGTVAQEDDNVTIEPGTYTLTSPIDTNASGLFIHGVAGQPRPHITVTPASPISEGSRLSAGSP